MAQSHTVEIKGIGAVLFEKSARARCLSISVKPFRGVRVAVPQRLSFKAAAQAVAAKMPWIEKTLAKMKRLERESEAAYAKKDIIDRKETGRFLAERLDELSRLHGLPCNKVFIRNQRTRWGSCSSKNNINLNVKLALLPAELCDYIMLHELVHTVIKAHNREFYAALGRLAGDVKTLKSRLNSYQGLLLQS